MSPKERALLLSLLSGPVSMSPSATKAGRRQDIRSLAERGLVTYAAETIWKKTGPVVVAYHVSITDAGRKALED